MRSSNCHKQMLAELRPDLDEARKNLTPLTFFILDTDIITKKVFSGNICVKNKAKSCH